LLYLIIPVYFAGLIPRRSQKTQEKYIGGNHARNPKKIHTNLILFFFYQILKNISEKRKNPIIQTNAYYRKRADIY